MKNEAFRDHWGATAAAQDWQRSCTATPVAPTCRSSPPTQPTDAPVAVLVTGRYPEDDDVLGRATAGSRRWRRCVRGAAAASARR